MGIKTLEDLHNKIAEIDEQEKISDEPEQELPESDENVDEEVNSDEEQEVAVDQEGNEESKDADSSNDELEEENPTEEVNENTAENNEQDPAADQPKYEPDMKFKAMKAEYELPEYLKNVIDSKEKEEEIKKVFSKAYGLDHFTQKNDQMKQQLEEVTPIVEDARAFNAMVQQGNLHSAMRIAQIGDDDILKLAHQIIVTRELTPEQQQVYNNQVESHHRLHQLEVQNQNLRQQFEQQNEINHAEQLDSLLVSDEVSNIASEFDRRLGKAGAFREAVINHAAMLEFQTKDRPDGPLVLSPKEAIDRVSQIYGLKFPESNAQNSAQVGGVGKTRKTPTNQTVVVKKEKPTIPNVNAGGKSPVKRKIKTLDDLNKLVDSLDEY